MRLGSHCRRSKIRWQGQRAIIDSTRFQFAEETFSPRKRGAGVLNVLLSRFFEFPTKTFDVGDAESFHSNETEDEEKGNWFCYKPDSVLVIGPLNLLPCMTIYLGEMSPFPSSDLTRELVRTELSAPLFDLASCRV